MQLISYHLISSLAFSRLPNNNVPASPLRLHVVSLHRATESDAVARVGIDEVGADQEKDSAGALERSADCSICPASVETGVPHTQTHAPLGPTARGRSSCRTLSRASPEPCVMARCRSRSSSRSFVHRNWACSHFPLQSRPSAAGKGEPSHKRTVSRTAPTSGRCGGRMPWFVSKPFTRFVTRVRSFFNVRSSRCS
jgi:hypothetical protein